MRGHHPQSDVTLRYRDDVTNKKRYVSTFATPMYAKLRRVVTQDERTPPTKSRDTLTTQSCDNSKMLYVHFHKAYGSQTQQDAGCSVVITIEVCAEESWLIQASAYSILFCQMSIIYLMLKKPSGCNGKLVLAKNKHKNTNQN